MPRPEKVYANLIVSIPHKITLKTIRYVNRTPMFAQFYIMRVRVLLKIQACIHIQKIL